MKMYETKAIISHFCYSNDLPLKASLDLAEVFLELSKDYLESSKGLERQELQEVPFRVRELEERLAVLQADMSVSLRRTTVMNTEPKPQETLHTFLTEKTEIRPCTVAGELQATSWGEAFSKADALGVIDPEGLSPYEPKA